uniref:Uncharacterized protein n=1 Tax=viral metagenome TaxID=1070528 RepID=A0A6M3J596_9ZZZZ
MRNTFIKIEDVLRMQKERNAINRLKFENIIWTKNNKKIIIAPVVKENWMLCGLNNLDFITSGAYKQKGVKE